MFNFTKEEFLMPKTTKESKELDNNKIVSSAKKKSARADTRPVPTNQIKMKMQKTLAVNLLILKRAVAHLQKLNLLK